MAGRNEDIPRNTVPVGGVEVYDLPHDGFNPAAATEADLLKFGLPIVRPSVSTPIADAFRRAFLSPPPGQAMKFMDAVHTEVGPPPTGVLPLAAIASQPVQKSLNWSGGYVTARDARSFVSVMANWTVPTVSVPTGRTEPEFHSSTWIGLDGQKFYLDSSLPQIGTKQICNPGPSGTVPPYAWFQWWARGQDTDEIPLGLPVATGDKISAIITVLDETTVHCNLKNVTQGVMLQAFDATAPGPCHISGATAEWIMERPSPPGSDGWEAYPLPAYETFAFTCCVAESLGLNDNVPQEHDLERARLIRMYEITANPTSVTTISTAHKLLCPSQKLELMCLYE